MTERTVDHRTAKRAALIAGVWAPLAVVLVGEAIMLVVGASGPDRLVTHWGVDGPDRTGPWWEFPVTVAAVDLPVLAFIGILIARLRRVAGMGRWLAPVSLGLTVMHTLGLGVGFILFNDAPAAPGITIGVGFAIGIVAAVIAGFALPHEARAADAPPVAAIPLERGEIAAWSGRVVMPGWFIALIVTIVVVVVVLGVVLIVIAGPRGALVFIASFALLLALGTTSDWNVAVGPSGVVIRSAIGWPVMRIPVSDIVRAGVAEVDPVSDFGGWGPRWVVRGGKGRWGFVSRRGPALEITRRDGRTVVATVDDAATAAAVLEAYVRPAGTGAVA